MRLNSFCMACMISSQEAKIRKYSDEEKKTKYLKEIMRLMADSDSSISSPALLVPISKIYERYWGKTDGMEEAKKQFNDLLLEKEQTLEEHIRAQKDPLESALCYARIGNYIDFSAFKEVSEEKLFSMLEEQSQILLDSKEYAYFKEDLKKAKSFVYLTDNCGEVVLDKIVIRLLKEQFPKLKITAIVRGCAVTNDVDMKAAEYVRLTDLAEVLDNGSEIAGTDLAFVSAQVRERIEQADIILSKGQGNFETIHGCGLNIYYLFLCKCEWFMQRFHADRLEGMFVNEKRI
ncbi:MAG: ARMT1-like domain-containing protein [[Ruminococcus] gnavus]|nr:ARMT1-like domain-containing protein [Mediterraneibacter gnavus]